MKMFTNRLKQRAADLGISNAEAARRCGLAERRYANYVSGDRQPKLAMLAKIAEALETTPDYLLGFGESEKSGPRAILIDRIASASGKLPEEKLESLAVQIEALAAREPSKRSPEGDSGA